MSRRAPFAVALITLVFATACNGQVGDAISSISSGASVPSLPSPSRSISLPTRSDVVATPSEQPSEAPTEAPTEVPSEAPTTEDPDRSTDRSPDRSPDAGAHGSPNAGAHGSPHHGADRDGGTDLDGDAHAERGGRTRGLGLHRHLGRTGGGCSGIAIIVAIAAWLILRRRRPSATMQEAYVATAAARDRLAQEASAPSRPPRRLKR